jgi:polysaccharide deacetylase family protein (PEP-CTERM system associated)
MIEASGNPRAVRHHFTVDVEEYFQVAALEPYVDRSEWNRIPARVDVGTRQILSLLAAASASGTFFTLGWIAKKHPDLVRDIGAAGHEIASHGWGHERVTTLDRDAFRRSVRDSKAILEDLTGQPVQGYRAPSFSIVRGGEWALDILLEEGYVYDSSLVPSARPGYGYDGGSQDPYALEREGGTLHELPPTTLGKGPIMVPAGGAYFRWFPYAVTRAALRAAERRGEPGTFYIHPWELDPDQPRMRTKLLTRLRHYGGLERTVPRLRKLLSDFEFQPIARTVGSLSRASDARRNLS